MHYLLLCFFFKWGPDYDLLYFFFTMEPDYFFEYRLEFVCGMFGKAVSRAAGFPLLGAGSAPASTRMPWFW